MPDQGVGLDELEELGWAGIEVDPGLARWNLAGVEPG
jgi:hypothetical protein